MSACTALYEFLSDIINSKDKSFIEWGRVVFLFFPVNFAKLHILSPAIGVRKKISQVPNPDSNLCFAVQFCFYFNSSKTEKKVTAQSLKTAGFWSTRDVPRRISIFTNIFLNSILRLWASFVLLLTKLIWSIEFCNKFFVENFSKREKATQSSGIFSFSEFDNVTHTLCCRLVGVLYDTILHCHWS